MCFKALVLCTASCCLEAKLNQVHKADTATALSAQTNSAGGVVGVDGDTLFLVRGCVVWLPVVDKEAVLRDEALDHLWEREQTSKQTNKQDENTEVFLREL